MKLTTALTIFGVTFVGLIAALSFALWKTSNLLDFEAHEIAKAGESIRVAQELKVQLLNHNRNSFLYQLNNAGSHFGNRQTLRGEFAEFINLSEQYMNSTDDKAILMEVKHDIAAYLKERDDLGNAATTPTEQYVLVSAAMDTAISSVDRLIMANRSQMSDFMESVDHNNGIANSVAGTLLLLGGVIVIGSTFFALWFLVFPMTAISKTIALYSSGQTSSRIKSTGIHEVRLIGSNFNFMAESLEEKRQDQLRFIAAIAHDLRNPLNSMSMASQILIQRGEAEGQEITKIIFRQVQNLDRLVGDLLDTTRIEAGKLDLNFTEQDVRLVIRESVELHRTGISLHNFKIELPNEAILCNCDGGRLSQVMNNLLSNAVKYSPNGGTVIVKGWIESRETHISVTDQGLGIEPRDSENIFKPFHRSKATKNTIPGIGLGLSASKRIIEAHGGKLQVESVLGKGSTFYITIPHP